MRGLSLGSNGKSKKKGQEDSESEEEGEVPEHDGGKGDDDEFITAENLPALLKVAQVRVVQRIQRFNRSIKFEVLRDPDCRENSKNSHQQQVASVPHQ